VITQILTGHTNQIKKAFYDLILHDLLLNKNLELAIIGKYFADGNISFHVTLLRRDSWKSDFKLSNGGLHQPLINLKRLAVPVIGSTRS